MTVESDPIDGSREALLVVLLGRCELSRQASRLELQEIGLMKDLLELLGHAR